MRPPTEAASLEPGNQVSPPMEGAIFPGSRIRRKVISQRQSNGEVQYDKTGDNNPCDIRHGKSLRKTLKPANIARKHGHKTIRANPDYWGSPSGPRKVRIGTANRGGLTCRSASSASGPTPWSQRRVWP